MKPRRAKPRTKYPWHDDLSVVDNLIVRFYRRPEARLILAIKARQEHMTETSCSTPTFVNTFTFGEPRGKE